MWITPWDLFRYIGWATLPIGAFIAFLYLLNYLWDRYNYQDQKRRDEWYDKYQEASWKLREYEEKAKKQIQGESL